MERQGPLLGLLPDLLMMGTTAIGHVNPVLLQTLDPQWSVRSAIADGNNLLNASSGGTLTSGL